MKKIKDVSYGVHPDTIFFLQGISEETLKDLIADNATYYRGNILAVNLPSVEIIELQLTRIEPDIEDEC